MVKVVNNVVKCLYCSAYVEYDKSDIKTEERGYESKTYKKAIILTESKLRRIITESVRNILNRLLS